MSQGHDLKLTSYSNYALRTLQLAALHAPDLVRVDDVVRVHKLARPHIAKIVHELGQAGYIVTVRGRGGGFRLARSADKIIVGEVLRITEGPFDVTECFKEKTNTCLLINVCKLSTAIKRATAAFLAVLDDVTIADIASNRDELLERIAPLGRHALEPEV